MMCSYGSYYGGIGGYAKADRPDIGLDGWKAWYRAAAEGAW